jgi:hypothetical protein
MVTERMFNKKPNCTERVFGMIRLRSFALFMLFLLSAACASVVFFGAGAATGVLGYKYYKGALTVVFQAPLTKTFDATLTALKNQDIKVESTDRDLTSAKIMARRFDKKPVTVSFTYRSANETEAVIRIGHLGNKDESEVLKDEIAKVLFGE